MAEALSQEEIDALLRGEAPPPPPSTLTPENEDAINKYTQMVAESGGEVYGTLLGEDAEFTVEEFKEQDTTDIVTDLTGDFVVADLLYKGLLQGKSVVLFELETALKITQQMTGGGTGDEFGDLEESALSEAVQSHFSSVNTTLSQELDGEITLETPEITTMPSNLSDVMPESAERPILIKYSMKAGEISGTVYQVMPRNLLAQLSSSETAETTEMEEEYEEARGGFGESTAPPVMSSPAQFDMGRSQQGQAGGLDMDIGNLELILDIGLEIKVELGRTHRKIREVLELGPGSVIELERLSGEPVDILVNDKLFAKGEVVVIDENFGVRITDILSIEERIEAIK